jgi:glycosyltransferase involved in cell wall biosynthesis
MPATILFLDHTALLGGGEIALLNLLRHLDRARYRPVVVLFSHGPLVGRLAELGVETHVLPLADDVVNARKDALGAGSLLRLRAGSEVLKHVWRLAGFIREHQVDLIHTNSLKSDLIGGLAARLARRPVVWHVRDRIDADYLPRRVAQAFRVLARAVPQSVVANSAATLRTLTSASGNSTTAPPLQPPRMHVVHDGTDCDQFQVAPPGPARDEIRIGMIGRISPWKGQEVFLNAAALLRPRVPRARFFVVGAALFAEKDYEARVRAMPAALGIEDVVEFTGFRDDVNGVLAQLDILVHASTTGEPFGQVVIEAMAAGKAVVATDGGGIPEIVVDGQTGCLVPMSDPRAMADAIARLCADLDAARAMGLNGRRRVEEKFTIQRTASRIEQLYRRILRTDRRPPAPRNGHAKTRAGTAEPTAP